MILTYAGSNHAEPKISTYTQPNLHINKTCDTSNRSPPPDHTSCIWHYPRCLQHVHAISLYSKWPVNSPVISLRFQRKAQQVPVVYLKVIQWWASIVLYPVWQPNVQSDSFQWQLSLHATNIWQDWNCWYEEKEGNIKSILTQGICILIALNPIVAMHPECNPVLTGQDIHCLSTLPA